VRLNIYGASRDVLQRDFFTCKLPTPTTAVAGTLLSPPWDLALPRFLGGAFFWSNLRDLFNDDLRAGVLRV
jgi:hypothetical protein